MSDWVGVCTKNQLIHERGVAALVGGRQVALFRVIGSDGADFVYAVGHHDPASGANVIARGIVGSTLRPIEVGEDEHRDTVASPIYKHVYDLRTGECYTDPQYRLDVYRTWVAGGIVYVHPQPVTSVVPVDTASVDGEQQPVGA